MPDAKGNTKLTGDTHLPEVESEFDVEEANPQAAGIEQPIRGSGGRKAGVLKDADTEQERPEGDSPGK